MISIIRNFIAKQLFKKSGAIANNKSVDFSTNALIKRLDNYNIKPTDITSEDQLLRVLSSVKQAEDNVFNNKFKGMMENNKFFNRQSDNVVDLKNKKLDTEKPILGGTQETDEQILKRLNKENEDSINRLKNKKDPPEELAGGGVAGLLGERPGYQTGLKVQGSGSISGKQDMYSTGEKSAIKLPKGITSNESFINFIANLDIPISEKISLLGDFQYTKSRNKIEKGDEELFVQDPASYINKKIGIGINQGNEGFSGSAKYDVDSGEPEFNILFKKSFAQGGPARQNFKMGKRAFLKFIASGAAGIAGLKTGLLGFGKKETAKEVAKEVATSGGGVPPYFLKLVNKIRKFGDDVTEKSATLDRQKVTKYKEYELTEDVTTGEQTIQRMKVLDDDSASYYGQPLTEETYMSYKPGETIIGKGNKPVKTQPEYEEGTALLRSDREFAGEVVEESAGVSDDIFKEVGEIIPEVIRKTKADGGRAGYKLGKKVLQEGIPSLIKKVNKLFNKEVVTTADKIKTPQKTLDREMFSKFKDRNPDPKREITDDEFQDLMEDVGDLDAYNFDGTIGSANKIRKEAKAYQDYMYQQYKMGKLDPEAGDKSPARKKFLQNKFDEAEASGDNRLITRNEIDELQSFDLSIDDIKISETDMLMKKYPGMDRALAEQIATEINPRKKADIIAMVEQTIEMGNKGMSGDDIIQTFKNTPRTKQASGGRIGYNAGNRVLQGILKLLKPKAKLSYLDKYPRVDIKELMKGEKPIKLYSGVGDRQANTLKAYKEDAKFFNTTVDKIKKDNFKGQWFTPFKEYASSFGNARNLNSKMLTTELTPREIKMAKRYVDKINKKDKMISKMKMEGMNNPPKYNITTADNTVIIPKIKLKKLKKAGKVDTDYMVLEKIKSKLGLSKGGIAGMLGE